MEITKKYLDTQIESCMKIIKQSAENERASHDQNMLYKGAKMALDFVAAELEKKEEAPAKAEVKTEA